MVSGKEDIYRRCVHFYACVCAFASDEKLLQEFSYYIDLDTPSKLFHNTLEPLKRHLF